MSAADAQADTRSSGRDAGAVAAGILASRVAGLVREILFAIALGLSPAADALRAAIRVPNLLQNLLGEGVLSASFIPVHAQLVETDPARARRVAAGVLGLLTAAAGTIALIVIVAARPIARVLALGLQGERFELVVDLLPPVAVGAAFLVPSAWCLGVLNSHRRFFVSYVAPVAWNLVQIVTLVVVVWRGWAGRDAAEAVALALALGGLAQFAVQLPSVRATGTSLRPRWIPTDDDVRDVVGRFGPAVVARGSAQLVAYLDLWLASFLAAGAIASLALAQVLYLLPISLFAMSVAAAELPALSRLAPTDPSSVDRAADRVAVGLRRILVPTTYAAAVFVVAGIPLAGSLFAWRDSFGRDETIVVAAVLAAFGLGVVPAAASRLLQNARYAVGDVRGPARLAVMRMIIAAVAGALLMFPLDRLWVLDGRLTGLFDMTDEVGPLPSAIREDPTLPLRLGAVGLALGAALGAWFEFWLLRQRVLHGSGRASLLPDRGRALLGATLISAAVAGGLVMALRGQPEPIRLAVVGAVTGPLHLYVCHRAGIAEVAEVLRPITRRIRRGTSSGPGG